MPQVRRVLLACSLVLALGLPASARADLDDPGDQWLPRSDGATWVYEWSNSHYSPAPRTERYTIQSRSGPGFRLRWLELDTRPYDVPSSGTIDFRHTDAGLVNVNYQSTPPPPQFPILCASASNCGNSLAGAMYLLVWGSRSPTLAEPLLAGTRWSSLGGTNSDVASTSRYLGLERIAVPAFPGGVLAAKVESELTQAGALGDPFGSGVRTAYWVRGVGPVQVTLRHGGGEVSVATLRSTNLAPRPAPPDVNLLPLNRGSSMRYRWRNSRHMKKWSRQQFDVSEVVNNTARVDVKHRSGPIKVEGSYALATRLGGVTHLSSATRAATLAKFPALGPRGAPKDRRRRFFTPFDLMVYGFGPVVPINVPAGYTWRSSPDHPDWRVFGVTGRSRIAGTRRVKVPAGTFSAVVIDSTLKQNGFRFGSGTRRSYFVPGKGLVKLVFRHGDGSVSSVERLK